MTDPSFDPYRPPEAVQRSEVRPEDPPWVGKPSTCKRCKVEFVVENRYRRFTCADCDGRARVRGWWILAAVLGAYIGAHVLYVLILSLR